MIIALTDCGVPPVDVATHGLQFCMHVSLHAVVAFPELGYVTRDSIRSC
jgi:hypothetical protein